MRRENPRRTVPERHSVLPDLIVAAGALGDAHGACRVGWNGKLNSSSRSGHYALIVQE